MKDREGAGLRVLAEYFDELLEKEGDDLADGVAATPPALPTDDVEPLPEPEPEPEDPYALAEVAGSGTLYRAFPVCGFRVLVAEADIIRVADCDPALASVPATARIAGEDQARQVASMTQVLGAAGADAVAPTHVLLARGCSMALLLPGAGEGVRIEDSAVTWRGEGGSRPWLGGTMREQRTVVVDLLGLHGMACRVWEES